MSSGPRIIKNSIILTTGQVLSKVINLGLILVLTRILGSSGFGLYSFSFAYVSLFGFLIHLGLITLIVREIAKYKDQTGVLLGKTLPLVIVFSSITFVLMNTLTIALGWDEIERTVIFFFSLYIIFDTISRYFLGVTRAFEQMEYSAITGVIERILLLVMAVICWIFQFSLIYLVVLFTLVQFFKAISSYIIVTKYFSRIKLIWWPEGTSKILKEAYPFAIIGIFTIASQRIDLIFLKYFYSADMVGIYSAARRLIESLNFIPESIYFAIFPALSIFFKSEKEKFDLTFQRTLLAMIILALPISAGLFILAPNIINILFEPEFYGAVIALRWLAIAILAIFMRYAFLAALSSIGKQQIYAVIAGIALAINIIANIILIPKYQIAGASIAVILSEITIIVCSIPVISKTVEFSWLKTFIPKIIFIGIIMFGTIYMVKEWPLISIMFLSISVYIFLLFILKIVSISEIKGYIGLYRERLRNTKMDNSKP